MWHFVGFTRHYSRHTNSIEIVIMVVLMRKSWADNCHQHCHIDDNLLDMKVEHIQMPNRSVSADENYAIKIQVPSVRVSESSLKFCQLVVFVVDVRQFQSLTNLLQDLNRDGIDWLLIKPYNKISRSKIMSGWNQEVAHKT